MKKEEKYLLSICIPTYNRADVLRHCIDAIVNHEQAKKGGIEIVVCDNASTDGTETLMQKYKKLEFVKYYRNEENIGVIHNTLKVLDVATGEFRKLLNDYSVFTDEGLQSMYDIVVETRNEKPVLLFDNKYEESSEYTCQKIDEIVHHVGYWLTWMGIYGYWEEDWESIQEREKYNEKTFTTIDWLIQMLNRKKVVKVCRFHYNDAWSYERKQGGYNFFKVFVKDYFDLWKMYEGENIITPSLYKWLKKDMWTMVWRYTQNLLIRQNSGNFGTGKGWGTLLKYYGNEWYLWRDLIKFPFGVVKRKIKKGLKK